MPRSSKIRLYTENQPRPDFNQAILGWLRGECRVVEHQPPRAFDGIRSVYDATVDDLLRAGNAPLEAHKATLSTLTTLFLGHDLISELRDRLPDRRVNEFGGSRTTLSQGAAKNVGENFVNCIVYAIAQVYSGNDNVIVDKGLPPHLKRYMQMKKLFGEREIEIKIESDMCIFRRDDPFNAIVLSAKTRLKEVFHIGTMWKIFLDMIGDPHCLNKWGLTTYDVPDGRLPLYAFATADMVNAGGENTQGPDVERDEVRNLIAMDASFFDYVFVSKRGISHVANTLDCAQPREALFHELGCLLDLVEQKIVQRGALPGGGEPRSLLGLQLNHA